MRETKWDTAKARDMKNEGRSAEEIAAAVGATPSAVKSYFTRVAADDQRLQEKLDAMEPREPGPGPLSVHDAAEMLYALDQLYPGARLRCATGGERFFGLEISVHHETRQARPDVTIWLK